MNALANFYFLLLTSLGLISCGEPEIKLTRADRKSIDTIVSRQLDSISPILDSLCDVESETIIQKAVDSIMKERRIKEERLRLNTSDQDL